MDFGKIFSQYSKIIVELGMGDGRLLESLAKNDTVTSSLYLGVELKKELCDQFRLRFNIIRGGSSGAINININNNDNSWSNNNNCCSNSILIVNGSFEDIISEFPDFSVDRFIAVLPDPAYIDEKKQEKWIPFYKKVHSKLKNGGTLQLVTEITDELLQPVSDGEYFKWTGWLDSTFSSMGFSIFNRHEGVPDGYHSRCLDQFRGDPERIRIVTLEMQKRKREE